MTGRLPHPALMLVTDRFRSVNPLCLAVPAAIAGGVDLVQLREPDLPDREIRRLVARLIATIGPDRILINGRPVLAAELGLGLHLREDQPVPARGPDRRMTALLGQSFHGAAGTNQPEGRIDYVLAGNVYPTRSHSGRPGRGLGWLRTVVQSTDLPVLAIGGITLTKVTGVMAAGCHGVAVIDAILASKDPEEAAAALRAALDEAAASRRSARNDVTDNQRGTFQP